MSGYDSPEDAKVPFSEDKKEEKEEKTEAAPPPAYSGGGAFAGYDLAPVPAPAPAPAPEAQGAAASYYSGGYSAPQSQGQNLPSTNPFGRQ